MVEPWSADQRPVNQATMPFSKEFEDDRIRRWREDQPGGEREPDPTVLDLNLETEDVLESRTYGLSERFLEHAADQIQAAAEPFVAPALIEILLESASRTSFKILAKCRKEDQRVTFMFVLVTSEERFLIDREDLVDEARFREFVADVERGLLGDVANPPTVITRDEWPQYLPSQEKP